MSQHPIARRAVLAGLGAFALSGPGAAQQRAGKPPAHPVAPEPALADLVAQVSGARLRATVESLAAFPTRWSESPAFPAVEAHVAAALAPTRRQSFRLPSGVAVANLIAGDPLDPRGVVLVGAHYDSISEAPDRRAPGANDNASGVAALLEVHRLLAGRGAARGLVCVAFAGEEQGFLGSEACAALAQSEGWRIDLMLNLDMLGASGAPGGIVIEYDQGNAVAANNAASRRWGLRAAELAAIHTRLTVRHGDIWGSDYMPFEALGYSCIGLYDDGAEGPRYHSSTDTPEGMDFDRLEQAARLAVAIVADALG